MSTTQKSQAALVSCIVPVFNGERYVREAIESVFAQTYAPLEVVVVDDGSTDDTLAVLENLGEHVRIVRQENAGPAAARNRGVRAAGGEFVAFLDADDLWHPEKVARQMARFAARPEIDLCVTHAQNFWIPELRQEAAQFAEHRIAKAVPAYLASTLLVPRATFAALGEFDSALRFGHSTEWFLRAAERGLVVEEVAEVLYYRRLHRANRTRRLNAASREEFLDLVRAHIERKRRGNGGPNGAGTE